MGIQIGFDAYTIEHRHLSPRELLMFARDRGLDGVQFLEPGAIVRRAEAGGCVGLRRFAAEHELYVEIGMPSPNPVRRARELGREVTTREHAEHLVQQLDLVAELGCRHARVFLADRHDRFRSDVRWDDQLDACLQVLRQVAPALRDRGMQLAIENHADMMVSELLRLLDRLDPAVFGVTLDTGNLLMRLENPVLAAESLAPRVLSTHVKDAVLAFTARGLCWQVRPVGSGILPMPDILAPVLRANPGVKLSIELHPRTYDLPIYDRKWLGCFPDLRPEDLAAVVRLAATCESRFSSGELVRPEVVESIPWDERDFDWLARSLGYLRSVVPTLSRLS